MRAFTNVIFKLALLGLLCWPMPALAELPAQLQSDFSVVKGVVVMPMNDEYIVDLDDRDNLHVGDILTLVKPGSNIFHPVSKEVIGTIDETVGYLQVTRILSGYSYARVLTNGLQPENGAQLKRFEQVPAILVTDSQADAELARQLQVNLPQFRWLQDSQADQAQLTFHLQEEALDVRTARGDSLHKYIISEDQRLVTTVTSPARRSAASQGDQETKPLQQLANTLMSPFSTTPDKRFAEIDEAIIRQNQKDRLGIWMGPNLAGHPTGLAVADLDGDGLQEIAVVLEKKIQIARVVEGQFKTLAEVAVPGILQVLCIDALDLDNDGRSELYLSALAVDKPSSFVVQFDGSHYAIGQDGIRWLLRAATLPGEEDQTLVGQRLGNIDKVFAGDVFRVQSNAGVLVAGDPVGLPEQLNLFNFAAFTDAEKQLNYVYLTSSDYLNVISADGEKLWASDANFGGSEDCFTLKPKLRDELDVPTCMPPRLVMMPGNEILAVQNDGQRIVQRYRSFDKSRLVALTWNGFALMESWQTATQPGYLGDFAVADADNDGKTELVMAVKFKHGGLTGQARSAVVMYETQ
ncbi:MAG: FG-GAP repeat domain-containing protein [Desulfuromonadales bacterium]